MRRPRWALAVPPDPTTVATPTVGAVTAQDEFGVLLKEHIGPGLRERGWKGSGLSWMRPHPTHWVLVGWQKSTSSNAATVAFTGDLKVIAKDAWDAENVPAGRAPTRPSSATSWGVGWEKRLGEVMPDSSGDRWWSVRAGDGLAVIAQEVMEALDAFGLPAIEQQLASAAEQPRQCRHNVGGRNWFEPCRRVADIEVRSEDRVLFRCAGHAEAS